mmetsp:Transcript_40378/g.61609  ORF Transcript_40378/g.61609 Transcript_40378/m.61609 type:complete len:109 (-) Transcript_40378:672-998(-)
MNPMATASIESHPGVRSLAVFSSKNLQLKESITYLDVYQNNLALQFNKKAIECLRGSVQTFEGKQALYTKIIELFEDFVAEGIKDHNASVHTSKAALKNMELANEFYL